MPKTNVSYQVGYGKPPVYTQFSKGRSGNPNGRPKCSKNIFSVIQKASRERVKVTQNGRVRTMTKMEATAVQLSNKAAAGDLRAAREILTWNRLAEEAQTPDQSSEIVDEADRLVMASLLKRIKQSDSTPTDEPQKRKSDDEKE
jgi:hypothetical protein